MMKKLYISLLIITVGYLGYIFLHFDDQIKNKQVIEIEENHIGTSQLDKKKINPIENVLVSNNFANIAEQNKIHEKCGFDEFDSLEHFYFSRIALDKNKTIDTFTVRQKQALNRIYESCLQWYEYLQGLTSTEKDSTHNRIKSAVVERRSNNNWYDLKVDYSERLNSARNVLADDPEYMGFAALYFLLENDLELIQEIANRLQTQDWSFIRASRMNVALLYSCINTPSQCATNSANMFMLCIDHEQYCDLNYNQYLAIKYSSNQFADIQNIVSYLNDIINEGYPDIQIPTKE